LFVYIFEKESQAVMGNPITPAAIKALREKTGAGMMECKAALTEAEGNEEKAIDILRKRGLASATKKAGRVAAEGLVHSYIHAGGKIGVLVEVNCETDFVARGEEFRSFVHDLAMHIAAAEPRFLTKEEVSQDVLDKEREIALEQARTDPKNAGKPQQVLDKIIEGRLSKFYQEACLMEQPFVKDQNQTVGQLVTSMVSKTGENIKVRRFVRFKMGEGLEKRVSDIGADVRDLLGANQ
jgi:elongation factor Ts